MNTDEQLRALLIGLEIPPHAISKWLKQTPAVFEELGYCMSQKCRGKNIDTAGRLAKAGFKL